MQSGVGVVYFFGVMMTMYSLRWDHSEIEVLGQRSYLIVKLVANTSKLRHFLVGFSVLKMYLLSHSCARFKLESKPQRW